METNKCVALIGLALQAAAAVPPALIMWFPEQPKFSGELGIIISEKEILSPREKTLLRTGLILLFVGTILQGVGLFRF